MRRFYVLVLSLILNAAPLAAQTLGSITGTVKDPSGAIAANVPVTATNTGTQALRSTVSNNTGDFTLPDLVPGTYQVRVTASGFQPMVSTVEIQVQQTARVDFTLALGQASSAVEVSSSAADLTTESATVGTVIENRRISDLPLNGRDFFQLVALSPSVTYGFAAAAQASSREGGTRAALTISLTGQRATWNNYTLDGVTNTDIDFNLYILQPSVDALQEFKVQSGIYPAEFGREAGQINVSTKSGTNGFHGSLFEFLRNDKFDARPYDFVPPASSKQPYRQNQYGFVVSGPVWLPKIYNGKNRLFFMSNFEGFKTRLTTASRFTDIPAAMRAGDFSSILPSTPLYDPLTRCANAGNSQGLPTCSNPTGVIQATYFPGNIIPASRLNPTQLTILSKYNPLPNLPSASPVIPLNNYIENLKNTVDKRQVNERIDFNENSNSQWFGRYSWTAENSITPGETVDGSSLATHASQWMISNIRVLSPSKVNEARFGYSSIYNNITQQLAGVDNVDADIGVTVPITNTNSWGVPYFNLSQSLSAFGNATNGPYNINDKYLEGLDNFSWIHGKHAFRFGGEYRYNKFPQNGNEFPRGEFWYQGQYTANPQNLSGGYAGADFVMGDLARADFAVNVASARFNSNEWSAYLDDTWKVTPKLTVTLGLRWEVEQPLYDASGNEVNVQLNEPLPNVANVSNPALHPVYVREGTSGSFYQGVNFVYNGIQTARDGRLGSRLINTNYNNFAPRVGIAWSPTDQWVVRTGFGIFYSQEGKNSIFDLNRGLSGRATVIPNGDQGLPTLSYANFLNGTSLPIKLNAGLTWGAAPNLPTTYSMMYLVNVQRKLGRGTTLEVGYNGVEDRHLDYLNNENEPIAIPGVVSTYALQAPYPEFNIIQFLRAEGIGNYNGLGIKLTQRYSNGLTTLIGYTWSKALDDSSAVRGVSNDEYPANARCRSCDYGYSAFNVPSRLVASVLYSLPFGHGKRFLSRSRILDEVAGGWQVSSIITIQSGMPIDTSSWDAAGTAGSPIDQRLNAVPGVSPYAANPNANNYLNPAGFSNLLPGTYGTMSRNNLIGPRTTNIDFSAIKDFRIVEKQALQFRMEMFNAPNHPELGSPNATWGTTTQTPSASFGLIRSTATTMRQIQFALKYVF